ncbi:MAG: DoxX family protein [Usitatibacter sp.]
MIQNNVNAIALVGRILIALLFVISGFGKIAGFAGVAGYIGSKGLPMPQVLAALTIALELGGGILLIAGYKVRWVAIAFFLWLIPTTFLFHAFWSVPAAEMQNQMNNFLKNVSIMGAMLYLAAFGPGAFSVEKK